jgi:predicted ATPase
VKILTPQAILGRLEHSLTLLTGGARDLPARQQTLRDAIAWSYDLLEDDERRLFARLAVFVGGFSLEALDAVCNPGGELGLDTLDGVASLTNKSLLRQMEAEAGEQRFFMLETIREYAAGRLSEAPLADEVRDRHADFCLDLALRAAPELTGADQVHWLESLSVEHDNFRAALTWLQAAGDADMAQRLGGALWRFWQMRGYMREGLERLEAILAMPGAKEHPEARALALEGAGGLAYWMALPSARRHYEECLAIRRTLGDRAAIAEALYNLSFTDVFAREGPQIEAARRLVEESMAIFREIGDDRGLARALWGMGLVLYEAGELEAAEAPLREALAMHRQQEDRFAVAWDLFVLGLVLIKLDRHGEARSLLEESLSILAEARDTSGIPLLLAGLSTISVVEGEPERAVRLAGAAAAIEAEHGGGLAAVNEAMGEWESKRRATMSEEEYEHLWAEGQAMSLDEAVSYALQPGYSLKHGGDGDGPGGLPSPDGDRSRRVLRRQRPPGRLLLLQGVRVRRNGVRGTGDEGPRSGLVALRAGGRPVRVHRRHGARERRGQACLRARGRRQGRGPPGARRRRCLRADGEAGSRGRP